MKWPGRRGNLSEAQFSPHFVNSFEKFRSYCVNNHVLLYMPWFCSWNNGSSGMEIHFGLTFAIDFTIQWTVHFGEKSMIQPDFLWGFTHRKNYYYTGRKRPLWHISQVLSTPPLDDSGGLSDQALWPPAVNRQLLCSVLYTHKTETGRRYSIRFGGNNGLFVTKRKWMNRHWKGE